MKYLITFIIVLAACFISYEVFGVRTFTQDENSGVKKEPFVNKKDIPINTGGKYNYDRQQGGGAQNAGEIMPEEAEENMPENTQENIWEEEMPREEIQDGKEIQKKETSQEVMSAEPARNNKPEPKEKVIKPIVTGSGEYKTY